MTGYAMDVAPEGVKALWGARAILNGGYVDILHDRQSLVGDDRTRLLELLNGGILRKVREDVPRLVNAGVIRSDQAEDIILYLDDDVIVHANTNASYGYLYLTAWLQPKKLWCYYVNESMGTPNGFIPAVVTRDEPGYSPLSGRDGGSPWYWGNTIEEALRVTAKANAEMGVTETEAHWIVMSSMMAGPIQREVWCRFCDEVIERNDSGHWIDVGRESKYCAQMSTDGPTDRLHKPVEDEAPRHDEDGQPYIAYFRSDLTLGFIWSGKSEDPVQVTREMGEPVIDTFEVDNPLSWSHSLSDFQKACDEYADRTDEEG